METFSSQSLRLWSWCIAIHSHEQVLVLNKSITLHSFMRSAAKGERMSWTEQPILVVCDTYKLACTIRESSLRPPSSLHWMLVRSGLHANSNPVFWRQYVDQLLFTYSKVDKATQMWIPYHILHSGSRYWTEAFPSERLKYFNAMVSSVMCFGRGQLGILHVNVRKLCTSTVKLEIGWNANWHDIPRSWNERWGFLLQQPAPIIGI